MTDPRQLPGRGTKAFHGLGCRSAASLCLSQDWSFQTTEFEHGSEAAFTGVCFPIPLDGDHSAGSSLAAGQILCFQLQVSGNAGQPAHLQLGLEDKSKMDITAWGGCVTLSAGQVWVLHPLEGISVAKFLCLILTEWFFSLYLLSNESLEVNLFWVSEEEKETLEKFHLILPDMVVLGLQLSLRTELCQPLGFLGETEAEFHGYRPSKGSHRVFLPRKPIAWGYTKHFFKKLLIYVNFFHFPSFREY